MMGERAFCLKEWSKLFLKNDAEIKIEFTFPIDNSESYEIFTSSLYHAVNLKN
jgi:hypothetical protein